MMQQQRVFWFLTHCRCSCNRSHQYQYTEVKSDQYFSQTDTFVRMQSVFLLDSRVILMCWCFTEPRGPYCYVMSQFLGQHLGQVSSSRDHCRTMFTYQLIYQSLVIYALILGTYTLIDISFLVAGNMKYKLQFDTNRLCSSSILNMKSC